MSGSKSRDVVPDPFGGSGSTLIAAETTGRQARLVELDPKYCDVIVRRWQEFAGGQATLAADGRRFEEIAAAR
jgi:DNA modification methylase